MRPVPWYWIMIILSAVIGPFEAYYVINRAWKRKNERDQRNARREKENKDQLPPK